MKKSDLERISNGMAQGRGEYEITDSDGNTKNYNIVGAVNAIVNITDEMEKYGLAYSDLTAEQQETLDHAQKALQYFEDELGTLLGSFTGNDGSVTLSDGTTVDLPNAATSSAKSADLPSVNN